MGAEVVGSSWLTLLFEILLLKQRFKLATPDLKAIVYPPPPTFYSGVGKAFNRNNYLSISFPIFKVALNKQTRPIRLRY
jgi:hypothetical protein